MGHSLRGAIQSTMETRLDKLLTPLRISFSGLDTHKCVLGHSRGGMKTWHGESGSVLHIDIRRVKRMARVSAGTEEVSVAKRRAARRRGGICHGCGAKSSGTAEGMWGLSITQDPRLVIYLVPAQEAPSFLPRGD